MEQELMDFLSSLPKKEKDLHWRKTFNYKFQKRVIESVIVPGITPICNRYPSSGYQTLRSPSLCVRQLFRYFFLCYKKQQSPVKPEIYHFVAAVAPDVFTEVTKSIRCKITAVNDRINIDKSLLAKWIASKVNKYVHVLYMDSNGLRVPKFMKVERATKTTAYICTFENTRVRFNIGRDSIYENKFRCPTAGGMIVKNPNHATKSKFYKQFTEAVLTESTLLPMDILSLITSFIKY